MRFAIAFLIASTCTPAFAQHTECYDWFVHLRFVGADTDEKDVYFEGFQTRENDFHGLQMAMSYALHANGLDPALWLILEATSWDNDNCDAIIEIEPLNYEPQAFCDSHLLATVYDERQREKLFNIGAPTVGADLLQWQIFIEEHVEDSMRIIPRYGTVLSLWNRNCFWGTSGPTQPNPGRKDLE